MDAVTHQPLGKHAAIKGADGVFYWDLNRRPEITPGVRGTLPNHAAAPHHHAPRWLRVPHAAAASPRLTCLSGAQRATCGYMPRAST